MARKPKTQSNETVAKESKATPELEVRINKLYEDGTSSIKAVASINIGNAFAVHGVKVMESAKGMFVSMPNFKGKDGYKDIFHPITKESREQLYQMVLEAYENKLSQVYEPEDSQSEEMKME